MGFGLSSSQSGGFGSQERHSRKTRSILRQLGGRVGNEPEETPVCCSPLSGGGLGFSSAQRVRRAAHFASWADTLSMVRQRQPPHCGDHDSASTGGNCSMFPGGSGSAENWWKRLAWKSPLGQSCPSPLPGLRRNQNQTYHGKVGSRRPPNNWRFSSCPTWCGRV